MGRRSAEAGSSVCIGVLGVPGVLALHLGSALDLRILLHYIIIFYIIALYILYYAVVKF